MHSFARTQNYRTFICTSETQVSIRLHLVQNHNCTVFEHNSHKQTYYQAHRFPFSAPSDVQNLRKKLQALALSTSIFVLTKRARQRDGIAILPNKEFLFDSKTFQQNAKLTHPPGCDVKCHKHSNFTHIFFFHFPQFGEVTKRSQVKQKDWNRRGRAFIKLHQKLFFNFFLALDSKNRYSNKPDSHNLSQFNTTDQEWQTSTQTRRTTQNIFAMNFQIHVRT